jgi:hypothetical protein
MNTATHESLSVSSDELAVLAEVLEAARTGLLVEMRHTHHRTFRDYLRKRLTVVDHLNELVNHPELQSKAHPA